MFNVGDRVKCVNADGSGGLIFGRKYVISRYYKSVRERGLSIDEPVVEVAGRGTSSYFASRFELCRANVFNGKREKKEV
jgi:hypothetical protein